MAYHYSVSRMKKLWRKWTLPLLSVMAASSCDMAFGLNKLDYSRLNMDLGTAWRQTASYKYILDTQNYWKSPREFEADGGGDCEDFAIHLMYHLGEASALYVVKLKGQSTYHAIVHYNGQYLEPQIYNRVYDSSEFSFAYTLSYAKSMLFVTNGGSKHIYASGAGSSEGLPHLTGADPMTLDQSTTVRHR